MTKQKPVEKITLPPDKVEFLARWVYEALLEIKQKEVMQSEGQGR